MPTPYANKPTANTRRWIRGACAAAVLAWGAVGTGCRDQDPTAPRQGHTESTIRVHYAKRFVEGFTIAGQTVKAERWARKNGKVTLYNLRIDDGLRCVAAPEARVRVKVDGGDGYGTIWLELADVSIADTKTGQVRYAQTLRTDPAPLEHRMTDAK